MTEIMRHDFGPCPLCVCVCVSVLTLHKTDMDSLDIRTCTSSHYGALGVTASTQRATHKLLAVDDGMCVRARVC